MKKLLFSVVMIFLATAILFPSCKKKEENLSPDISFISGTAYVSDDVTLNVNTEFTVKVKCETNSTSNANIKSLKITREFNNQIIYDTTLLYDNASFTIEASFLSLPLPGIEKLEFTATDSDQQSAKASLKITTE